MRTFIFALCFVIVGWQPCIAQEESARATGRLDAKVFESQPAEMAPNIFGDRQKTTGVLRILTVDERMGYARKNELVRAPIFFHEGECADPNALQITPVEGGAPVPYQADDIRRDATGKVARMHVYFNLEVLPAWGRKQFHVAAGKNPGAALPALPVTESAGRVTLAGGDIQVTFHASGNLAGAIAAINTSAGKVTVPEQNLAPAPELIRQAYSGGKTTRQNALKYAEPQGLIVKQLTWGSGPLFAKLVVQMAPKSAPTDVAEYTYLVPKFGAEFTQMERLFPEEKETREVVGAKGNALLYGKVFVGDNESDQSIVAVPAGLRKETRGVFKYQNKALVNAKSGISLTIIPFVQMGARDVARDAAGNTVFQGSTSFQTDGGSNSGALRVWWGQARFVLSRNTDAEALWRQSCEKFQPLTAVVDEPWATPADVWNFAKQVNAEYWKIQYWGRGFEANLVMSYLSGKDVSKLLESDDKTPAESNARPDLRPVIPSQEAIEAAWKKTQGAGALDPYTITYGASGIVPFSACLQPSPKLDNLAYAIGQASRLVNEQTTPEGWPNIRSFANTSNMKIGTYLCALWGGMKTGDRDLLRWARDAATSQNLLGAYGRGQRPYNMSVGVMENSDVLYMSITDYWLRAMELIGNEDLSIHPAVYGRYFDMIDVNADIYQRKFAQDKVTKEFSTVSEPTWWRATFLRGQAHDHRWESYGCDPFLGLLGKASDHGKVGVTETCYYLQKEVGKPQSWQSLMTNVFFPAVLSTKALERYQPAPRPPLPQNVKLSTNGGKISIRWSPVTEAAGYRVYRASQMGGPWTWVNSPYRNYPKFVPPTNSQKATAQAAALSEDESKAKALGIDVKKLKKTDKIPPFTKLPPIVVAPISDTLVKETVFTDREGEPGSFYLITAEDKDGRESRWFPNEPLPAPSH
jgi:hypothetical protein